MLLRAGIAGHEGLYPKFLLFPSSPVRWAQWVAVVSGNSKEGQLRVPAKKSVWTYVLLQAFFETNERFDVNPLSHSDARFGGF